MIYYPNPVRAGTDAVISQGDGYSITVTWFQAEHSIPTSKIAYHIYFSTVKEDVFTEGPKFVSIDGSLEATIQDLVPGQLYFFAIRPVEYDPVLFDLENTLPIAYENLRVYPQSILREDISKTDLIIPLMDVDGFPSTGIIKIGEELIQYLAVDQINKNLIVAGGVAPQNAKLIDQGGGNYYTAGSSNIGQGTINNLNLIDSNAITQTWTIRSVFVEKDTSGDPITGTAKFISIGSISSTTLNQYGDPFIWVDDSNIVSNGILSFSITDGTPFLRQGDEFIIKVAGATKGYTGRGYANTTPNIHTVSGYDGYNNYSPIVSLYTIGESRMFDRIFQCQSRFEYPNYPFTMVDGYHQVLKDLLNTDLTGADASNVNFPSYDYSGYHRTDPVQLLTGVCVGSYIGGEMGCIDGYGNVNITRGLSLQDQNTQRQDVLLSLTGRPAVLLRKVKTGITCACYLTSSEYPDDRCPKCYGTKFVFGYEQYFNPRRSDGRILVRVGPTDEKTIMQDAGMESDFPLTLWTLAVPTVYARDVIILFDQDNNEEFRYEITSVTRNNTIVGLEGGQLFRVARIRKYDPAYQIRAFRDTSDFPSTLITGIGFVPGIPPHTHEIRRNEKDPSTWSQTTQLSQGHNHPVYYQNGELVVMEALGHTHKIII